MKKLVLCMVVILTLVTTNLCVFADTSINSIDKASVEKISDKYALKSVEQLPDGVRPREFKNVQELEKFLKAISAQSETVNMVLEPDTSSIITPKDVGYYKEVTCKKGETWVFGSFYLACDVTVYIQNTYKTITDCTDYMMMDGFDLGMDYTESYRTCTVASDKKSLSARAKGTLDYYLLVDGLLRLYSKPYDYKLTFNVSQVN